MLSKKEGVIVKRREGWWVRDGEKWTRRIFLTEMAYHLKFL